MYTERTDFSWGLNRGVKRRWLATKEIFIQICSLPLLRWRAFHVCLKSRKFHPCFFLFFYLSSMEEKNYVIMSFILCMFKKTIRVFNVYKTKPNNNCKVRELKTRTRTTCFYTYLLYEMKYSTHTKHIFKNILLLILFFYLSFMEEKNYVIRL